MRSRAFQWQFVTFFRILFGLHLVYSGGAYVFFGWVPAAFHNEASPAGNFMVMLDQINLYPVVKYVEFTLGLLVLSNRLVPLAAVMEFPITITIAYLNLFVEGSLEPRHYYTGFQELAINGVVLLGYGAYYQDMLEFRAIPRWLGESPERFQPSGQGAGTSRAFGPLTTAMWLSFLGIMAAVLAASWFLGSADRRLPPRDWLPPMLAFAGMIALTWFHDRNKGIDTRINTRSRV